MANFWQIAAVVFIAFTAGFNFSYWLDRRRRAHERKSIAELMDNLKAAAGALAAGLMTSQPCSHKPVPSARVLGSLPIGTKGPVSIEEMRKLTSCPTCKSPLAGNFTPKGVVWFCANCGFAYSGPAAKIPRES